MGNGLRFIDLFGSEAFGRIDTVHNHPVHKLVVENYELLESISVFVNNVMLAFSSSRFTLRRRL